MAQWTNVFDVGGDRSRHQETRRLLPSYTADEIPSTCPAKEVTKIALRLKYQIEQVIPCEIQEGAITDPNSRVITKEVIRTAKDAGGDGDCRACVIYCLLVCLRWFKMQAVVELWDSEVHGSRALACEVIAKRIIENEEDQDFLLKECLLKRYSVFKDGEETIPVNVIERAVDLHALMVIGSSGYQKCIKYLWLGWMCQEDGNPTNFVEYKDRANTDYWVHFKPGRMRSPVYQNICQITFSFLYLLLYTAVINTVNRSGDLDIAEWLLYIMTLAFICDEANKVRKVGRHFFEFWTGFNSALYTLIGVSFCLRIAALTHSSSADDERRRQLNELSYNFLAFSGPMFWMRMMLYLDSFRFFGAMFVVLRVMMKESLIFFALLFIVTMGFFQAFSGMAQADNNTDVTRSLVQGMANSIMQSPEFSTFEDFAFPFGIILYYMFNFIVMIVLLNILIALYNTAYENISEHAVDEYMAIFAQKTMQFVRAPDENVFIPPFNLIEIIFMILPFEWWMPRKYYLKLNYYVMGALYSPLLLVTAWIETREAHRVLWNRHRGEADDDDLQEWERIAEGVDFEVDDTWRQSVAETQPNVRTDGCTLEVRELRKQVMALTETVKLLMQEKKERVMVVPDGKLNVDRSDEAE